MRGANKPWWRDANIHKSKDVPWRRKNSGECWPKSSAYSPLEVRTGQSDPGQKNQRLGDKNHEVPVQIQRKRGRNADRILGEDSRDGKDDLQEDEAFLSYLQ